MEPVFKGAKFALERGGAADQIIADLQEQILQGKLPHGTKLPNERALADRYGVSGPTIREAVRGLVAIKMVEPRHGAGTYVTAEADIMFAAATTSLIELKKIGLIDILDLLATLYERIAVLVCDNAEDVQLAGLAVAIDRLDEATDEREFSERLGTFLGDLADASHSVLLAAFSKFFARLLIELAREQHGGLQPGAAASLRDDRRRMVEALIVRDTTRSRELMVQYCARTKSMVGGLLEAEGSGGKDHLHHVFRRLRRGH
jgi:GntR family transcriptional regulator, transcriptional repressor for pyruvate dehydrogenase complex